MDIEQIIKSLSLEEKAALLQGAGQWVSMGIPEKQIPALFLADGPHGLCRQMKTETLLWRNGTVPATCFPTASAMANSWDPELAEEMGKAMGKEAAAADVHVLLGPGLNMKRSPLCGRNFEYYAEDPYLAGKLAAACIRGIQSRGTAACAKHFAVNSREWQRMTMNAAVDERTMRELYLTAFEIAVKEGGVRSVMSAYNRVNGTYANENRHLLTDILREEWGFDGFVVTDWGADNDHVEGVRSGCNLVMPTPGMEEAMGLVKAVREGRIAESVPDDRVRELLRVALPTAEAVNRAPKTFDREAHHELAKRCAAGSIVLLENDGILPLQTDGLVAVIGDFAKTPRYQGAGSSLVNPTKLENLWSCLQTCGLNNLAWAQGFRRNDSGVNEALLREAAELAARADTVLLCVGLDETLESEGMDRKSLALSEGQNVLIEAVCRCNENVVLVLCGGAPFLLPEVPRRAVIHGYLGGQAGAAAMAEVLLGRQTPCGKLAETWPMQLSDTPAYEWYDTCDAVSCHREGLLIGYRHYDTKEIPVRYPFGHGLSYTEFEYRELRADRHAVSFTVKNTGSRDGAEIAQVYISCPEGKVFRPRKELKGFRKVWLRAGEEARVTVPLDDKAFRYYNTETASWETETAEYEILVGSSAEKILLRQRISVTGSDAPIPTGMPVCPDVDTEEGQKRPLGMNDPLCCLRHSRRIPARMIFGLLNGWKRRGERKCPPDLNAMFVYQMPLRAVSKLTGGAVSGRMAEDLRLLLDGHFCRGAGKFLADAVRGKREVKQFHKLLEQHKLIDFSKEKESV